MQIVFEDGTELHELDVVLHDPDALVSELVAALAPGVATPLRLFVDGREVPGDRRLDRAGITDAAVVRLAPVGDRAEARTEPPVEPPAERPVAVVEVIGGLDAGRRTPLAPGTWSIGRCGADVTVADPAVSTLHATLAVATDGSVVVTDHESLNGTWIAGVPVHAPTAIAPDALVRVGASHIRVGPPLTADQPDAGRRSRRFSTGGNPPFNRPPRVLPSNQREPLEPPQMPSLAPSASAVGVISVVAPLVLGLVMVKVFHNWLYGMFALLSPVMLVGNVVESKRRDRKTRRRERSRYACELASFSAGLAALARAERAIRLERLPTPAEILRRATGPSTRLWERRPDHDDFLALRGGLGTVSWTPPVEGPSRALDNEVRSRIAGASSLQDTPVEVDLAAGGVVGLFGPRQATLAVARSLVAQAVTLHGPADLPVAVLVAHEHVSEWDWAKWLPHTVDRSGSGRRMLAADAADADRLLRDLLEQAPTDDAPGDRSVHALPDSPTLLLVLDDESLTEGRRSPARSVLRGLAGPVAGIVVAGSEDRLPAVCTTVIEVANGFGEAVVYRPATGDRLGDVLMAGLSEATARTIARALARFEDPESDVRGAGLPPAVSLLPLLRIGASDPEAILHGWQSAGCDPDLVAPIGVAADGVLALDLARDGPHALVAGTTGSGKSELLRSLVVGLAVACSPEHLTFVLIDFKGGSAFDQCSHLPHTVGLVTDLDDRLGARALRCLEAELRHRERNLRAAGAGDLTEYRRRSGERPAMPRLVVVIDEFATLKNELPDFVDALVGIAQRGRSLGVHLVLATQRPSGAVSENIRANANLRIALRVQDANDSKDVIDRPDAALLGRNQPGRALVRLGPGEIVPIQTALSTGLTTDAGRAAVEVRPFRLASGSPTTLPAPAGGAGAPGANDLSRLVTAIAEAFAASGQPAPRRPWPDPLPDRVDLDDLFDDQALEKFGTPAATLCFALADLPEGQVQRPTGWIPADGNLLLIGVGGSGTTTALSSIALAAARTTDPDDLHVYVLDFGAGELGPLIDLPHTAAVITADERERQTRLMRRLTAELSRRRTLPDPRCSEPRILLLLDGMAGFRAAWDETDPTGMHDDLVRIFADGPDLGVHAVISADRPGALPQAISALARQRLLFRLGDRLDYGIFGLSTREVPDLPPGGAVIAGSGTEIRIGRPSPDLATAVASVACSARPPGRRLPPPIRALPDDVDPLALVPAARLDGTPWFLPIGIGDALLAPVGLTLYEAEHALIAGPSRSGRTTALQTLASVARAAHPGVTIVAISDGRSALRAMPGIDRVLPPEGDDQSIEALGTTSGPLLVLVDDADLVAGDHAGLERLLALRLPDLHVVAAGRAEALRATYGHWTRAVRASRTGLLLQPDRELDGDLLGVRLPRQTSLPMRRGRGYLVTAGDLEIVQVARSWPKLN